MICALSKGQHYFQQRCGEPIELVAETCVMELFIIIQYKLRGISNPDNPPKIIVNHSTFRWANRLIQ